MSEPILIVNRMDDNGKQTVSNITIIEDDCILLSCAGLELPWLDNKRSVSCIPKGEYECIKVGATANIPYDHISVLDVPNRSGICIHKANYVRQLRGCIAVGEKHIDIDGDNLSDVTNSGKIFNVIMILLPDKFKLRVI